MVVKEELGNVFDILKKAKIAVQDENSILLRELSNRTVHTASTAQDTDSILLAVIIYSLSKVIERPDLRKMKDWSKCCDIYKNGIDRAIEALDKKDQKKFILALESLQNNLTRFSKDLKPYIQDVFRKAKINKASKIYEHGLSLERTAKLFGITVWELAQYTGQKEIKDVKLIKTKSIKERVKEAEELFE
jgi:hypothetical protein